MHAATQKNPIRHLVAILATLGLVFTGTIATVVPASGLSVSSCANTNSQTQIAACQNSTDVTMPLSPASYAVAAASVAAGNISQAQLKNAGVNMTATDCPTALSYSVAVKAGSSAPSGWTVAVGASNGTISLSGSGTPAAGSHIYVITGVCTNSNVTFTRTADFTLDLTSSSPNISPSVVTISGVVGTSLSSTLTANNFAVTPTFTVRSPGSLPAGLSLNTNTGVISGNPTAVSNATVTIDASSTTPESASSTVTFSITAGVSNKVTICHRTHSTTNPYVRITVNYTAVDGTGNSDHNHHDEIFSGEHVFKAGIYIRAKDKLWGDIIPADPSGLNRWSALNWTTLGAAIYNGTTAGCPGANTTPVFDKQAYFNQMREAGVPVKEIKAELDILIAEQHDADPTVSNASASSMTYGGTDTDIQTKDAAVKVTICHRTNALTNPYRRITVDVSSLTGTRGHAGHNESYNGSNVFNSTANFYPTNHKDWGDIIPSDPQNRWQPLNWDAAGQAIYNNTAGSTACPADGAQTLQQYYNKMREDGKTKKEILQDLEDQKNDDDNPNEKDGVNYTGNDTNTENSEPRAPKPPVANRIDQSLSGIVWLDINRDGLKDPDEPLMPGITVNVQATVQPTRLSRVVGSRTPTAGLFGFRQATVTTVTTDANGYYEFPSLAAGYWQAVATVPSDLSVTYDSYSGSDGSVTTQVPAGSSAFTWVGLVGTAAVNQSVIDGTYGQTPTGGGNTGGGGTVVNPTPTPVVTPTPGPTTPAKPPVRKPTTSKPVTKPAGSTSASGASVGNNANGLAFTGSNSLQWLLMGLGMAIAGLVGLRAFKRKPNN